MMLGNEGSMQAKLAGYRAPMARVVFARTGSSYVVHFRGGVGEGKGCRRLNRG
jgi:hypothetical protein